MPKDLEGYMHDTVAPELRRPLINKAKILGAEQQVEQLQTIQILCNLKRLITPGVREAIIELNTYDPSSTFESYISVEFQQVFDDFVYVPLIESQSYKNFHEKLDEIISNEVKPWRKTQEGRSLRRTLGNKNE